MRHLGRIYKEKAFCLNVETDQHGVRLLWSKSQEIYANLPHSTVTNFFFSWAAKIAAISIKNEQAGKNVQEGFVRVWTPKLKFPPNELNIV